MGLDSVIIGKRSTRRSKGLCEHCAYDTQGLAKCPECGAETPSAATIQA